MQIDKETVLNLIRERVGDDKAREAERELPDQVDTDEHRGILERFGVDSSELLGGVNIPGL